ncbi:hypothetical protein GGR51DRAFT_555521 [Nemania sp. FL0031]|nr:hypothetical protein GGR51DRAFT_555521 [Nemania sp. FL0031]
MAPEEKPTPEEMTPKGTPNCREPLTSEETPTPAGKPITEGKPTSEKKQSPETSAPETPIPKTPATDPSTPEPSTLEPSTPTTPTLETPALEMPAMEEEAPALAITKYLNLPDELMLKMLNRIPDYHWPEAWFIVRRVSQTWKFEAEKIFQQRYLSSMGIMVGSFKFYFDPEQEDGERAFFKCKQREIGDGEWQLITRRLAHGYSTGNTYMYMISFLNLGVINDTAFADLDFDAKTRRFSFKWLPTVGNLFREETKVRKMLRNRVDQALEKERIARTKADGIPRSGESKEVMYWKMHRDASIQEQVLMAVRKRPWKKSPAKGEPRSHPKARRRSPTSLITTLPIARAKSIPFRIIKKPGDEAMFSW